LLGGIALAGAATFTMAGVGSQRYPLLFSHAGLAFVLGLRHAVDCDHLAAIDNVTRQLLNRGQTPISVGFWFALGHSSIVFIMTGLVAGGYSLASSSFHQAVMNDLAVVAGFLAVCLLGCIGFLNARIAIELLQMWASSSHQSALEQDKHADGHAHQSLRTALSGFSFLRRIFDRVDKPHKMFGVGLLFGLSFDTATQVGLIGLAAISGSHGQLPPALVMLFPMSFSCGMCLVDTGNGLLMLMTYGWAKVRPSQKLFYNLLVTSMAASIALLIGSLEFLQVVANAANLHGPFWDAVLNVDMASIGFGIIATFATVLVIAVCYNCRYSKDQLTAYISVGA
jgi:high-affinity nickel-transport protein